MSVSIGESYAQSTGGAYVDQPQTSAMPRTTRTPWERIREALVDSGRPGTQQAAASLLGIKQPSVSDWKRNGSAPSLDNAMTLAVKLNVCVEWLLTERGPKRPGPPMDRVSQALWDAWSRIPPEDRLLVLGFAEAKVTPSQRRTAKPA
jgi:transcriptional regulator with XRE-family HTH domain